MINFNVRPFFVNLKGVKNTDTLQHHRSVYDWTITKPCINLSQVFFVIFIFFTHKKPSRLVGTMVNVKLKHLNLLAENGHPLYLLSF